MKFRKRFVVAAADVTIRRDARDSGEWLAERYFLVAGSGDRVAYVGEPKLMGNKTAWAHYQAWTDTRMDLRVLGHDGVLHRHFWYDRAVAVPLYRHQCQFSFAEYVNDEQKRGRVDAWERWIKTFNTMVECYNHDAHKALEWGMEHAGVADKEVAKFAFVAIE